jgi:hypothetical protein
MGVEGEIDQEVLLLILKKGIKHFDQLSISDKAYLCLNSALLKTNRNNNNSRRNIKALYLDQLVKYIMTAYKDE